MSIKDFFAGHLQRRRQKQYMKMMRGYIPVFSSFGNDIYASDLVQNAIRRICTEMSKLQPRHIITDRDGMQRVVYGSDLNRLLRYGPNPLMTTSDFLEKIVYLREVKKNCYILPVYDRIPLANGKYKRRYTALYPLNPSEVEYSTDDAGNLYITFWFQGNPAERYEFRYEDIIHWRKDFTENDIQGGDEFGNPDPKSLLRLLETDHVAMQSIEKGVKTSNSISGIIKQNTMLDDDDLEKKTKEFEAKILNNQSGFLVMDLKNEFIQAKLQPEFISSDVSMQVIQRILSTWGMSIKIYNGEFDEESYQAFYECVLESMIISLGRVFSRVLFTQRELDVGNEIIFYNEGLQYMKTENKIQVATILTNIGSLTDNQVLAIFGYPPFDGGNIRHQSLNYVNRDMADAYQMLNAGGRKKEAADGSS